MISFQTKLKRLHNIFKPVQLSIDTSHAALVVNKGRKVFYNLDQYSIPVQTIKDVKMRRRFWYTTLFIEQTPNGWLEVKNLEYKDAQNIKEMILFLRSVVLKQYSASITTVGKMQDVATIPTPKVLPLPEKNTSELPQKEIPGPKVPASSRKLDPGAQERFFPNREDKHLLMTNDFIYECLFVLKYERKPDILLMGISLYTEDGDHLDFHIISSGQVSIRWHQNGQMQEVLPPVKVDPTPGGKENKLLIKSTEGVWSFSFNDKVVFSDAILKSILYRKTLPGIFVHSNVIVNAIEKLSYQ